MTCDGLLLVDAGNTRVKWAAAEIPGIEESLAIYSHPELPLLKGEIATAEATFNFVRTLDEDFPNHYVVLSSVVPALVPLFTEVFGHRVHFITWEIRALGFSFDYPNPAELGTDRLAAAVAAHASGQWPAIIVSCGTATAFTVLDAKGRLCGGAIAPGLQTQLDALLGATAQLPATELTQPISALAKSTQEAIRAGVMMNFQGGAKEIIRELSNALGQGVKPSLILTGGNAHHLTRAIDLPHTLRPLLVFEGLRIIGNRLWDSTDD